MKLALCTGINSYPNPANNLAGCRTDAANWSKFLADAGFHVTTLFDLQVTRSVIKNWLNTNISNAKAGDVIVWQYSGHGTTLQDQNGDEADSVDEALYVWDGSIRDDDLRVIFNKIPKNVHVVVALDSCLDGETEIPLLDGTNIKIKDLCGKEEFWVYSCDTNGIIKAGRGHSAHLVKESKVIKIVLDNDNYIECTEDHRFMMRDGTYKEAKDLIKNDSLMPLYRIIDDGTKLGTYSKGYEVLKHNSSREDSSRKGFWQQTHLMVAESTGIKTNEIKKEKPVCHHKDYNKLNNNPNNLEMLSWEEHYNQHKELKSSSLKQLWQNPEFLAWRNSDEYKKQQSIMLKEKWEDEEWRAKHVESNIKRFKRDGLPETFVAYNFSEKNRENSRKRQQPGGDLYEIRQNPEFIRKFRENAKTPEAIKKLKESRRKLFNDPNSTLYKSMYTPERLANVKLMGEYRKFLITNGYKKEDFPYKKWKEEINLNNHKVKDIIYTNETKAVYDISVDTYNNFATTAGVFVHNCFSGSATKVAKTKGYRKPRFIVTSKTVISNKKASKVIDNDLVEVLISGCSDGQYSFDAEIDGRPCGAFSYYALKSLKLGQTYNEFYTALREYLPSNMYPQTPLVTGKETDLNKVVFNIEVQPAPQPEPEPEPTPDPTPDPEPTPDDGDEMWIWNFLKTYWPVAALLLMLIVALIIKC